MDSCEQQLSEAYMRATCVVLPDEEEIQFLLPTGTGQVCVDRQIDFSLFSFSIGQNAGTGQVYADRKILFPACCTI
jgi:hypothetical protein